MYRFFVYLATALCTISLVGCSSSTSNSAPPSNTANTISAISNNSSEVSSQNNVSSNSSASSVPTKMAASPFQGRSNPLAGVYHPYRLHIMSPLKTVSGTVEIVCHESDRDYHINLKLDPQYVSLINSKNNRYEHSDLVVEIIPMDQHDVPIPHVGEHISATGAYVTDADHGWMEIHPAWFINGHGSANYTASAAAASVQTGLSGNGDDEGTGLQTTTKYAPAIHQSSTTSGLSLVRFTQDVTPGEYASITVHGVPGTTASITVVYKSGPSHASGLVPEPVGTSGNVTWQWKVGTHTTPGNWLVNVEDSGKGLTETLHVR